MDTRQPPNSNLGSYRKLAKDLKRAAAHLDEDALARLARHHPKLRGRAAAAEREGAVSLGDAQLVVAREHGYATWTALKRAVVEAGQARPASPSDLLVAAVRDGKLAEVQGLLATDPALARRPNSRGELPLVEACDRGALAIAELLLVAGADPLAGDPLLAAAHAGPHKRAPALDVVALLFRHGAPDDVFTHALLGREDALRRDLVNVDLEARGPANATALFLAAWNGQLEAVRVLLEAGADANPVGRDGRTAWQMVLLHLWSGPHRAIARLLLEHGVACKLEEACILSHLPTVQKLLATEPLRKDEQGPSGKTPLEIALLNVDRDLMRVLLEAGAADPKGQGRALMDSEAAVKKSFARSIYRNCSFEGVNFHDVGLADAIFSNVNLSGALFDNVNLSGARIANAGIKGMTIYGIEIEPLLRRELERRARLEGRAK